MNQLPNPWSSQPRQADTEPGDMEAVWAAYRDGVNDLGRAEAHARETHDAAAQARADTIARAEQELAVTTADREELETTLGVLEERVRRVLDTTGVSPDGAGTGTMAAPVVDVAGARAAITEITGELGRATADLAVARAARKDRRRALTAVGTVLLAVAAALVWLSLLGTNTVAVVAGSAVVLATTMLGRRRGPLTAGITAVVALAAVVLTVSLVGPILATTGLVLAAVIAVIVMIRPRPRRSSVPANHPASSTPGGSRV